MRYYTINYKQIPITAESGKGKHDMLCCEFLICYLSQTSLALYPLYNANFSCPKCVVIKGVYYTLPFEDKKS